MDLPTEYVVQKFYQYAGYPRYKKLANVYEACCPICREGQSWGKKRRLYYMVKDNHIFCHNCGWSGSTIKFIQEIAQISFNDILREVDELDIDIIPDDIEIEKSVRVNKENLPVDAINLFNEQECNYYTSNSIVREALLFVQGRRLDTAVNRPKTLWISLTDYTHRDRLVIPFYDENNKIIHYQSRGILKKDLKNKPKYLSKINSDKTLFNINNIDSNSDNIFILEGPIDSFFLRNSVAVAGIQENSDSTFVGLQYDQIKRYSLFKKIWVLDSQWCDSASLAKTRRLIDIGESVFIWPRDIGKQFKDLNDLCINYNLDEISPEFILKNTYSDLKAKLKLKLCL